MKCKFCECTEERPCAIPMRMIDDQPTIARAGEVSMFTAPCAWLIENVCSAPACVEKAYNEAALVADQIEFFLERGAA